MVAYLLCCLALSVTENISLGTIISSGVFINHCTFPELKAKSGAGSDGSVSGG